MIVDGPRTIRRRDVGPARQPVSRDAQDGLGRRDVLHRLLPAEGEPILLDGVERAAVPDEERGHQVSAFVPVVGQRLERRLERCRARDPQGAEECSAIHNSRSDPLTSHECRPVPVWLVSPQERRGENPSGGSRSLQKLVRGSNGFEGLNSPAMARSCNSHGDAPFLRTSSILSGSTNTLLKTGDVFMCSVAVHSLP